MDWGLAHVSGSDEPDLETVEEFQASPAGQDLLGVITDKGFQGLAFWHNGMKQFSGPQPMRLPGDAEGLKFRIMESDVLQAQVQAIGANPQKMALGEVYQARDHNLERDVAIKVLPPGVADNAQSLARLEREAKAVASLSHPNIMAVYDFGMTESMASPAALR